jgi:lysophospholipase L1-like esterase
MLKYQGGPSSDIFRHDPYNIVCAYRGKTLTSICQHLVEQKSFDSKNSNIETLILFIGTNDTMNSYVCDVDSFIEAYEQFIKLLEGCLIALKKIIVIGFLPRKNNKHCSRANSCSGYKCTCSLFSKFSGVKMFNSKRICEMNKALKEMCERRSKSVVFLDVYHVFNRRIHEYIAADGLHPSTRGNNFLDKQICLTILNKD